jgi:sigma-B regulation protein RsbU (phosphoserine phosphatase)
LVMGLKRARENQGNLCLCEMQAPVRMIFELTRFDKVFEIYIREEDAVLAAAKPNSLPKLSFPLASQEPARTDIARLKNEMAMAHRIQLSLQPKMPPCVPGLDLWGVSQPASLVGGDFFDFVSQPDQPFTFFIGDVSGMGLPAALLMTMTRAILKSEACSQTAPTPQSILQGANEKLLNDFIEAGMFVTAFVGQYFPSTRELVYANAGNPPAIYCSNGGGARLLETDGVAMGVIEETLSKNRTLCLKEGDVLVASTDGLHGARNRRWERFGTDRLLELVQELHGQSAAEISDNLFREIQCFCAPEPQEDDQTVVVLRCIEN